MKEFVDEVLGSINSGLLNPQSMMSVAEFIERIYLPQCVGKLRPSTRQGYHILWGIHSHSNSLAIQFSTDLASVRNSGHFSKCNTRVEFEC